MIDKGKNILAIIIIVLSCGFLFYWNWMIALPVTFITITLLLIHIDRINLIAKAFLQVDEIIAESIEMIKDNKEELFSYIDAETGQLRNDFESNILESAETTTNNIQCVIDKQKTHLNILREQSIKQLLSLIYLQLSPVKIVKEGICPHCQGTLLIQAKYTKGEKLSNTGYLCLDCGKASNTLKEIKYGKTDTGKTNTVKRKSKSAKKDEGKSG